MKSPTIKITEQELYELSAKIIADVTKMDPIRFNSRLMSETSRNFRLIGSLGNRKTSWLQRRSCSLFLFAGISFLALALKITIETYFRIH